jgi:hypothetical protein
MNEILKDIYYLILVFAVIWAVFYLGTRHDTVEQRTNRYDCALTEFVANIPQDIRNECRRRRINSINKQKD